MLEELLLACGACWLTNFLLVFEHRAAGYPAKVQLYSAEMPHLVGYPAKMQLFCADST
ncbi:MAG: hypothetical protein K0Q90_3138, partial [Paenibacillaceae bacterium]|nr:hypothetical protein [Paenibacillaceae bacterium]